MALQLDNNLIAIRERGLLEILDLALAVIRAQGLPLLAALALGAAPMLVLNDLLIGSMLPERSVILAEEPPVDFAVMLALLVAMEIPFAAAPATLYLGQSMFREQTSWRQNARDLLASLPQLLLLQGVLRGVFAGLFMFLIPPAVPFVAWPYLTEVILLERNPLLAGKSGRHSTVRRSRMLHGGGVGDLFARWLGSVIFGSLLIVAVWLSLRIVLSQLSGGWLSYYVTWRYLLPVAVWIVMSYFTVARFLAYLVLRIRREGWEIELALRSEAAQMAGGIGSGGIGN
jgi:hypothetical protein